jgi:hypothetical protein
MWVVVDDLINSTCCQWSSDQGMIEANGRRVVAPVNINSEADCCREEQPQFLARGVERG